MTWHWYIRRPDEIFCDLDNKRALARAMSVLKGWMREGATVFPDVLDVWLYPSAKNQHLIVRLKAPISGEDAATAAMWLGSDRLRGLQTLARCSGYVRAPDVLLSPSIYPRFYRKPDDVCRCESKHRTVAEINACPVMRERRGKAVDYFPASKTRSGVLQLSWGRIPKSKILRG